MLQENVRRIETILKDGHAILKNEHPERKLAEYIAARDLLISLINSKGSDIIMEDDK